MMPPMILCSLGRIVMTEGARKKIDDRDRIEALARFVQGDWGDIDQLDRYMNDRAIRSGLPVYASYKSRNNVKFYIVLEGDRSVTTFLLTSEK